MMKMKKNKVENETISCVDSAIITTRIHRRKKEPEWWKIKY